MNFLCNCGIIFCRDQRETLQNMFFNSLFKKNDSMSGQQIYNKRHEDGKDNNDDSIPIDSSNNEEIKSNNNDIMKNGVYCIPISKKKRKVNTKKTAKKTKSNDNKKTKSNEK